MKVFGFGLVFAAVIAGTAVAVAGSWGGGYFLPGAVTGILVCAAALLRHRSRVRAAVAGFAVAAAAVAAARSASLPAEPGPAAALGLAVLVGSAVRALPVRAAVAVAAAGGAVVAAGRLSHPEFSSVTVFGGLAWAGGVLTGVVLRLLDARRLAAVAAVRRDERLSIARELHDVVAHHVTGIVVQAQAAQLGTGPDPARAAFAGIEAAGAEALAAVRRVVGVLREEDGAAATSAGPERLEDLVRRFEGVGPVVHLRLPDTVGGWPAEIAGAVHRVVQEALTNVARHAPHATTVAVAVTEDAAAVTVRVADDAPPAGGRGPGGYGLVGMRERLEALGGTLSAGPGPAGGWVVHGTLPLPAAGRR